MSKRNLSWDDVPGAFRSKRHRLDSKLDLVSILTDFLLRDLALVIRTYMGIAGSVLDELSPTDSMCVCLNPWFVADQILVQTFSPETRNIDIWITDASESDKWKQEQRYDPPDGFINQSNHKSLRDDLHITGNGQVVFLSPWLWGQRQLSVFDLSGVLLHIYHIPKHERLDFKVNQDLLLHHELILLDQFGLAQVVNIQTGDIDRLIQIQSGITDLASVNGHLLGYEANHTSVCQIDPQTGSRVGASIPLPISVSVVERPVMRHKTDVVGVSHHEIYVLVRGEGQNEHRHIFPMHRVDVLDATTGAVRRTVLVSERKHIHAFVLLPCGKAVARTGDTLLLLY